MNTNTLVAVLTALVLAATVEAREPTGEAVPESNTASVAVPVAGANGMKASLVHPLMFNADDARSALAEAFAKGRRGKIEFSLRAEGLLRDIAADCDVAASNSPKSRAMAAASPSSITCRFYEGGKSLPARLVLQESSSRVGAAMVSTVRQGELKVDGLVVQISARNSEGQPTEYLFTHNGIVVGAVDLSDRPRVRFIGAESKRTRRAVMLGATAIGVLWSPHSSNLAALADQPVAL